MPKDLNFEQWVQHVFDHPITDPPWHFQIDQEIWDGEPLVTVQHMTRLFESPERLLKDYSPEQLEQGLWYIGGAGTPFTQALLDETVSWPLRRQGLQSIRTFYDKFFAVACTDELGHLCRTTWTPVNRACYMWWDLFPSWGHPEDPARHEEDQTVLQILEGILSIPSEACRESALHGLGHWQLHYPEAVQQIVDEFLATKSAMSPPLREYALAARTGCVQ